jgi:predicted MPP superfamily phosphohydrolase
VRGSTQMHSRAGFVVFIFAIALAAHLFVAFWLLDAVPRLRRFRRAVLVVTVGLCLLTAIGRFGAYVSHDDFTVELVAIGLTEWMIVILGAMPLALTMLVFRVVFRFTAKPEAKGVEAHDAITRREAVERVAGALALGASTACLGWGMVRGRHAFEVDEVAVRIPGLPRGLDGYTIAQVSDIHAGVFVGERELGEGLSLVRAMRADLIVATGDLVDFDSRFMAHLADQLGRLPSRDGVFAVFGNHDYYAGRDAVAQALRGSGVQLLVNDGRTIRADDGGGFALLGVDDLWATRWNGAGPDLALAASMVRPDAPRILLAHQPSYFDFASGKVALQLSGHTHGGQINPGFRPADFFMRYISGRYEKGGSTLWVNRGFGVAGPPSRVGSPPEVTKIVLVAA